MEFLSGIIGGNEESSYEEWMQAGATRKRKIIEAWGHAGFSGTTYAIDNLVRASTEGKSLDASRFLKDTFFKILDDAIARSNPQRISLVLDYLYRDVDEAVHAYGLKFPLKNIEDDIDVLNDDEIAILQLFAMAGDRLSMYKLGIDIFEGDESE